MSEIGDLVRLCLSASTNGDHVFLFSKSIRVRLELFWKSKGGHADSG